MTSKRRTRAEDSSLAGKRIFLRSPSKRDAKEFIALNRASAEFHRGLVSPPAKPELFADFIKRSRRTDSACFLICRIEDGAIVGAINLSQIFMGPFRSAYMGYYVGAQHAQRGYMTEAVQLMLRYAFRQLKLHRIEANIQPGNVASIALVKRVGFVREGYSRRYLKIGGRWRDHERWTMPAEDWG
jgi:ribosomal-protein-alanine N-acetyltransferase